MVPSNVGTKKNPVFRCRFSCFSSLYVFPFFTADDTFFRFLIIYLISYKFLFFLLFFPNSVVVISFVIFPSLFSNSGYISCEMKKKTK